MRIITIQPEPFIDNIWGLKEGRITFGEKTPYPFHVHEDGKVDNQDFWRGDPYSVVGFQKESEVQKIDLWWDDAVKNPDSIVGMYPVMTRKGIESGMYTYTIAIESVQVREVSER